MPLLVTFLNHHFLFSLMDLVLPLLFKFFISLCTVKQSECDLSSRKEETPLLGRNMCALQGSE